MTLDARPISDRDLMAYADGLLEGDPAWKAAVERVLASDPQARTYVAEIRAQNDEIETLYANALGEPVPDRLLEVLSREPQPWHQHAFRAAAVVTLVALAAGGGWMYGQTGSGSDWQPEQFAQSAALRHSAAVTDETGATATTATDMKPIGEPFAWLNQNISLEIEAPDLSTEGFALIGKEKIGSRENPAVRLIYRDADATVLNLFLRPRWEEHGERMQRMEADGVTVHYWLDGPLAFALTTDAGSRRADRVAEAIHRSMGRTRLADQPPATALQSHDLGTAPLTERSEPLVPLPTGPTQSQAMDHQFN